MKHLTRLTSVCAIATLLFSMSCGPKKDAGSSESGVIKIDGSSSLFPVTEAVAEEFQKAKQGKVKVTVGKSGTGGGFKKFLRSELDITDASRPISKEEIEQARAGGLEYIELPVCFDALTIVVNPQNDWVGSLTVEDLKKMWEPDAQSKVTHWNQVRPEWPNEKIALFGAGSDSGTFDYFTEAVVGKAKSSRGDYTASEDDNVLVQGIAGNKYALGYLPYAYYATNTAKLKAVGISWSKNSVQEAVLPTLENVLAGTYNPFSRPLFIYVNRKAADKPDVKEFVDFYLQNAAKLAAEVKYLQLPDTAYKIGLERFRSLQSGTGFGGVPEVGLHIDEIMKRTPRP